jgi:hypothetical protein
MVGSIQGTQASMVRRAWVVQEVAIARKAIMVCGTFTADWTDFMRAFQCTITAGGLGVTLGMADLNQVMLLICPPQINRESKADTSTGPTATSIVTG